MNDELKKKIEKALENYLAEKMDGGLSEETSGDMAVLLAECLGRVKV